MSKMTLAVASQAAPAPADAAQAYELQQRAVGLIRNAERTFVELGRLLITFRDSRAYESLGYVSLESWLSDPDVNLEHRQAYRLMRIAACALTHNIEDVDLIEIGASKAELIVPMLRETAEPEDVDRWVADARALAQSDLRQRIAETRNGHEPDVETWLTELGAAIIRRAAKLGRAGDPLALLDEISDMAIGGRAKVQGKGS